ncbi:hypothetical protein [Methylobacterium sp. AMS5]|uniref:hypothetical protein n=1 Tax=Methylobacterium sp. AMS5 TaxID=925818 RepID=UPI0011874E01|nr:hypothetical protein [Methylobacterium sp. AMS5]
MQLDCLARLDGQDAVAAVAVGEGLVAGGRDRPAVLIGRGATEAAPQVRLGEASALGEEGAETPVIRSDATLDHAGDVGVPARECAIEAEPVRIGEPSPGITGGLRLCGTEKPPEDVERRDLGDGRHD